MLRVSELEVDDERGLANVRGVSLEVRTGEIVALAGVDGNGQTELVDAISGLLPVKAGHVEVAGT